MKGMFSTIVMPTLQKPVRPRYLLPNIIWPSMVEVRNSLYPSRGMGGVQVWREAGAKKADPKGTESIRFSRIARDTAGSWEMNVSINEPNVPEEYLLLPKAVSLVLVGRVCDSLWGLGEEGCCVGVVLPWEALTSLSYGWRYKGTAE
jgi:hypothetical protein